MTIEIDPSLVSTPCVNEWRSAKAMFVDPLEPGRRYFSVELDSVSYGDVIETRSGRRYGVRAVRVQARGKHAGRQHIRAVVLDDKSRPRGRTHRIRWYARRGGGSKGTKRL